MSRRKQSRERRRPKPKGDAAAKRVGPSKKPEGRQRSFFGAAIRNPVFGLLSSIAVSIALFLFSSYEMKPRYAISSSEILASKEEAIDGLSIQFRGSEVETVRRSRLVLWNAGSKPIDGTAFVEARAPCIGVPMGARILSRRIVQTSRPDLTFQFGQRPSGSSTCTSVELVGDEAFERNDGVEVEFLYDGAEDMEFRVEARVKGVPEGFSEIPWQRAIRKKWTARDTIWFVNHCLMLLIGAGMLRIEIARFRKGERNNVVFGSFCFFPMLFFGAYVYAPLFVGLRWVSG